jgi:putative membrane protein
VTSDKEVDMLANTLTLVASHGEWEHHGFWPIWPLLWLLVLGGIVWFVTRRRGGPWSGGRRAEDILAERYARGEISSEEYRERLDGLR